MRDSRPLTLQPAPSDRHRRRCRQARCLRLARRTCRARRSRCVSESSDRARCRATRDPRVVHPLAQVGVNTRGRVRQTVELLDQAALLGHKDAAPSGEKRTAAGWVSPVTTASSANPAGKVAACEVDADNRASRAPSTAPTTARATVRASNPPRVQGTTHAQGPPPRSTESRTVPSLSLGRCVGDPGSVSFPIAAVKA